MSELKQTQKFSHGASESSRNWISHLEACATALFATLLIWAFLDPLDATSVFEGQALAQNLGWLTCGVLCAILAKFRGGFSCGRWSWTLGLIVLAFLLGNTFLVGQENSPRRGWHGFWQMASISSCLCCSALLIRNSRTRLAFAGLLLVGSVALSLQGIYQVTIVFPETRASYEADPDSVIASIPGLIAPEGSPQRSRFENRLYSSEPYSTFALANSLATLLSAALVLLGGVTLDVMVDLAKWRVVTRFGLSLCAAALIGGVVGTCWFLTLSRTAYVGVAAGLLFLLALSFTSSFRQKLSPSKLIQAGGGFAILLGGVLVALWYYDSVVFQEAKKSLGYRLEYWQSTLAMIQDHALTGVGLGNFQSYYPQYKLAVASEEIADPHNWLLDIAATLGLPVLICVVVSLLLWLASVLRVQAFANSEDTDENQAADTGSIASSLLAQILVGGVLCICLMALLKGQELLTTLLLWSISAGLVCTAWPILGRVFVFSQHKTASASIAILVCLLASGSWQASGLAIPLMVLLAMASPASTASNLAPQATSWRIAVLPTLALVSFVLQAWQPVNSAWAKSQQGAAAGSAREQTRLFEQAVELDPLDESLKNGLAQSFAAQALVAGKGDLPRLARRTFTVLDDWLDQDSRGYPNWRLACHVALDLSARSLELGLEDLPKRFATRALQYAERAVELYPTSVELRIQLSAIAAWLGQLETAEAELSQAVRLSEISPHQDKKLGRHRTTQPGDQQIRFPFPVLPSSTWIGGQPTVNAEPLIEWIRTKLEAKREIQ